MERIIQIAIAAVVIVGLGVGIQHSRQQAVQAVAAQRQAEVAAQAAAQRQAEEEAAQKKQEEAKEEQALQDKKEKKEKEAAALAEEAATGVHRLWTIACAAATSPYRDEYGDEHCKPADHIEFYAVYEILGGARSQDHMYKAINETGTEFTISCWGARDDCEALTIRLPYRAFVDREDEPHILPNHYEGTTLHFRDDRGYLIVYYIA